MFTPDDYIYITVMLYVQTYCLLRLSHPVKLNGSLVAGSRVVFSLIGRLVVQSVVPAFLMSTCP